MKKIIVLFLVIFLCKVTIAQDSISYSFIIQDSPSKHYTMRQSNQNYLSAYRVMSRSLYTVFEKDLNADLALMCIHAFLLHPMTHEEGHRSILTGKGIGSISQPYFKLNGAAYVNGVRDNELMNLRDTDLPNYIRLHGGGLESDYMLTKRVEALASFNQDKVRHLIIEYLFRKIGILQYYVTGLFKFEVDLEEEADELERDIVGYDTYGAARHLHRPDMDFYRYTRYEHLTEEEVKFVNRMGYRSLLNLINPLIIGKANFNLGEGLKVNAGLGYTMAPFGDLIDENIWLKWNGMNLSLYVRQFQNKQHWFHGFGLGINQYHVVKGFYASLSTHFWQQPKDYNFNTSESFMGGAVDSDLQYYFHLKNDKYVNAISIDFGMIYKTEGFLPEELNMGEHFGARIGTSVIF